MSPIDASTPLPVEGNVSLWDRDFFRLNAATSKAVPQLRDILRGCPCKLGPYLADVTANSPLVGWSRSDVSAVETHIVREYGKSKALLPLRILKIAVYQLNRAFQKCIPQSTMFDRLGKDPNLVTDELPAAQQRVNTWIEAEQRWIDGFCLQSRSGEGEGSGSCAPIAWEMVVASAALHGGIFGVARSVAVAEALAEPKRYFACSEIRAYADLRIEMGALSDPISSRWYPDDRLLLLMSRVDPEEVRRKLAACRDQGAKARENSNRIAGAILDGINRELTRQHVCPDQQPRSLADFLRNIELYLRSDLASVLVDFAAGKLPSRSLLPLPLSRINNDPVAEWARGCTSAAAKLDEEVRDNPEAYKLKGQKKKEPAWVEGLRVAFSSLSASEACQIIRNVLISPDTTPAGKQVCTLAQKLLQGTAYGSGKPWAFSSVRCCVLTVARRFAIQRREEDPASYSKDTFEELYLLVQAEAAEDSKTPSRLARTVAWALRQYHRHLVHAYKTVPVNEAIAFHVATGVFPVDARVISIEDLFAVIDYIETARNRTWTKKYRLIAIGELVLAFIGGLRRMEGLGLDPKDILPGPLLEILVRENEHRSLKTPNAERRVVLWALAYPFTELLDRVRVLHDEAKKHGGDFSCRVSEDVIIPIIHAALQKVTGDDKCHLHSLRHSAAHWMFLRLMLSDFNEIPQLFPHLPMTSRWLNASKEFRGILFHSELVENDHAWAVADVLGHANPRDVTLRHYVHCLDLLLALSLQHRSTLGRPIEDDEMRKMSGLPLSTAYARFPALKQSASSRIEDPSRVHRGNDLVLELRAQFARNVFRERFGLPILTGGSGPAESASSVPWPQMTDDILWMTRELELTPGRLAKVFGMDTQSVQGILDHAAFLQSVQKVRRDTEESLLNATDSKFEIPSPPRGDGATEFLRASSEALKNHVSAQSMGACKALNYLALHMLPDTLGVAFLNQPDPSCTRNCLALFRAMGFSSEHLHVLTCDGSDRAEPTRDWLTMWGLSWRYHAKNQSGRDRALKIPAPWVVIELVVKPNETDPSGEIQMQAIRHILLTAAVWFGAEVNPISASC